MSNHNYLAQQYQEMAAFLGQQKNLLISGHEDPDCDSLGSVLALYQAFSGAEKNWAMLQSGPIPENLRYLPHVDELLPPASVDAGASDAILLVDCAELARAGSAVAALAAGKPVYCIDHHMGQAEQAELALVDASAAAAAELVCGLIKEAALPIDDDIALCLYSALSADTGGFRYVNTSAQCLRWASELRPQVDLELVRKQLFENCSLANLKLLGCSLQRLAVAQQGQLAYSYLDTAAFEECAATNEDCHHIVNYLIYLSGVKVGILFEEYPEYTKISLRSRTGSRVDELARQFGGGGHMLAAGCKIHAPLAVAMPQMLAAAEKMLADQNK